MALLLSTRPGSNPLFYYPLLHVYLHTIFSSILTFCQVSWTRAPHCRSVFTPSRTAPPNRLNFLMLCICTFTDTSAYLRGCWLEIVFAIMVICNSLCSCNLYFPTVILLLMLSSSLSIFYSSCFCHTSNSYFYLYLSFILSAIIWRSFSGQRADMIRHMFF